MRSTGIGDLGECMAKAAVIAALLCWQQYTST